MRIQDLVGGLASEAKSGWRSGVELCKWSELSAAGVQGLLKGPGSFWVFNAQICILPYSRDSFSLIFDIYFKNCVTGNTLFQSIASVNVFKVEIYILKQIKKISTGFVFILPEM